MVVCSSCCWSTGFNSGGSDFGKIGGVFSAIAAVEIRQRLVTGCRHCRLQSSPREVAADGLLRPRRRHLIGLFLARLQVEQLICHRNHGCPCQTLEISSGRGEGEWEHATCSAAVRLKAIVQIFPATVWQSVFATDFALSMSNPYTRISNAELPFLTTRPKPARVVLLKYT